MLERARSYRFGVFAGYDGAIGIIEDFGCCRAEEHPPECAGMRGHDDEVDAILPGGFGDLRGRVSGSEDSWVFGGVELGAEEGVEPVARDTLMLFCDLGSWPQVKFESVVAGGIEDVDQRHFGAEQSGGPLDVRGHGD